mmetsp:Transcript_4176/g.12015  ORF Transcript_4176/g.12015 Transcript_4176/m.12015 type:complete len:204 (-) Transcript_4176:500-1111(-)
MAEATFACVCLTGRIPPGCTFSKPKKTAKALKIGVVPVSVEDATPMYVSVKDEEFARRVIAAIEADGFYHTRLKFVCATRHGGTFKDPVELPTNATIFSVEDAYEGITLLPVEENVFDPFACHPLQWMNGPIRVQLEEGVVSVAASASHGPIAKGNAIVFDKQQQPLTVEIAVWHEATAKLLSEAGIYVLYAVQRAKGKLRLL